MPVDYSKYPPNWKDEIRPNTLKRDKYKCRRCGVGQRWRGFRNPKGEFVHIDQFEINWRLSKGLKVITIYLAVAHLDHNPMNNKDSNLLTMCQQCHNRHDKEHRRANRLKKNK